MKQKFSITKFRRQEERPRSRRIRDRAGISRKGRFGLSRSLLAKNRKGNFPKLPFHLRLLKNNFRRS